MIRHDTLVAKGGGPLVRQEPVEGSTVRCSPVLSGHFPEFSLETRI